jgi:hypothetical protein
MPKGKLSRSEKLACELAETMSAMTEANARTAKSLISWCSMRGGLSKKQQAMASAIIFKTLGGGDSIEREYSLYAISDGSMIKLGYSCDVKRRLKSLQTAHPKPLRLVWKKLVGSERHEAEKAEKKLHRKMGKHKIRGEWFSHECFNEIWTFE